ncbi:MAG TPA: hypothetical protein VGL71_04840 [Urbifossiella sp.]
MTAILLTFTLLGFSDSPHADAEALANAERDFAAGVNARNDADAARKHFAEAAREFDSLWNLGHHNPALALNRTHAHRLAGNLPAAIAALHDGLAVARSDRNVQLELEDARSAVLYPHRDLETLCLPHPPGGIGTRMSPLEAFLAAGLLWLFACLGIARFAMTRVPAWLIAAAMALVSLAILGEFWRQDWRRQVNDNLHPWAIVKSETSLKSGNGESWPDRLKWKLPAGVEVRELNNRGGWVQVELAGGAVGWLPATSLMTD